MGENFCLDSEIQQTEFYQLLYIRGQKQNYGTSSVGLWYKVNCGPEVKGKAKGKICGGTEIAHS